MTEGERGEVKASDTPVRVRAYVLLLPALSQSISARALAMCRSEVPT